MKTFIDYKQFNKRKLQKLWGQWFCLDGLTQTLCFSALFGRLNMGLTFLSRTKIKVNEIYSDLARSIRKHSKSIPHTRHCKRCLVNQRTIGDLCNECFRVLNNQEAKEELLMERKGE